MKMDFTSDELVSKRHVVDLDKYGDFVCGCVEIDPEDTSRMVAEGALFCTPRHRHADEDYVTLEVELEVELDPYHWDRDEEVYRYPDEVELAAYSAGKILLAGWKNWSCSDIPPEWEF
jgi:hypothetical protein